MSELGQIYRCEVCNTEVVCAKAGKGSPWCCGQKMKLQKAKPMRWTA